MALPFLPAEHISSAFEELQTAIQDVNDTRLHDLVEYVDRTWMRASVWPPHRWSAYKENVRTNNDVEGNASVMVLF